MPDGSPIPDEKRTLQRGKRGPAKTAPHTIDFPVIGIGASAGGLEACTRLLDALGNAEDMAFILVQHLDPKHKSLMAELLAGHTSLTVLQAEDGVPVERNHLYIIPPASFLAVDDGALRLTPRQSTHGASLPFDFLLQSMARACSAHAVCVVLSGTGADGSAGVKAIKQNGGVVIVQDPSEADYDGMPRSAIETGAVDLILALQDMPDSIKHRQSTPNAQAASPAPEATADRLPDIIELLRTRTAHDFTLYKPGTLKRRVERRMAMAALGINDIDHYVDTLTNDPAEIEQLAKDLLIHVTGFFRDPAVFEALTATIVPELLRGKQTDNTLRIWVAGCSTGEEAYSLAMVFLEQITGASSVKLQIFASDADADAVTFARDGLYPGRERGRRRRHPPGALFQQGGARVSSHARAAGDGGVYRAGPFVGPAILPHRSCLLPELDDLSRS